MTDQFSYQAKNQDLVNQAQAYGCFDYNNSGYTNYSNTNAQNFSSSSSTSIWDQTQAAESTTLNQKTDFYQNFNSSQFSSSQQTTPNNGSQFNTFPPVQNNFSLNNTGFSNMQFLSSDNFGNTNTFHQDNSRSGSNYKGAPGSNRNSGHNFNKGDRSGGRYLASGMEEQHDTIFVSNLPENTTEQQLQEYFGSIGLIKIDKKTGKPKIWIYRDKESQKPKGEVTITYDDPPTAKSAINWFDGKEFYGSIIKVELAQRKNNYLNAGKNFGNRESSNRDQRNLARDSDKNSNNDRNSGSSGRKGDWPCPNPSCKNNNFAWRTSCNRCKTEKPSTGSSNFSSSNANNDRRSNPPPFERRNNFSGNDRRRDGPRSNNGSFNRNGRNGGQQNDRSFNKYGNNSRDQRGGGRDGSNNNGGPRSGGPMRGSDNKRSVPY